MCLPGWTLSAPGILPAADLGAGRGAGELAVAPDELQRQLDAGGAADGQVQHLGRVAVPGQREDEPGLARGQGEGLGGDAQRAQVLALEVDVGARRGAGHLQQRHPRGDAGQALVEGALVLGLLRLGEDLAVVAVGLVVHLQLLVAAGDVVDDVDVAHQAVGEEELAERVLVLAGLVGLDAAAEAQVGLVGGVVGAGGRGGGEGERGGGHGEEDGQRRQGAQRGHRTASVGVVGDGTANSLCSHGKSQAADPRRPTQPASELGPSIRHAASLASDRPPCLAAGLDAQIAGRR